MLAHELRNPLAPLRNGLEVMRLAPERVVALALISTSARPSAFRRAEATISGEMSHAVTSKPRSSSGMKLLPVPHPTSSRRRPARPCRTASHSIAASQGPYAYPAVSRS